MTDNRAIAEANEVLRGLVGSTAHGTGLDGHEDRDEMGVFIETPEQVCGLTPMDHVIYRTAPEGQKSGPDDLDLTLYSLRKFCRLATHGNPSVLLLLWLPDYLKIAVPGAALVDIRDAFVSADAGARFLGYLRSQKAALTGERNKKVSRPELVERFGYDTKFAMHALRLGYQGIEFLTERRVSVPVREPDRSTLKEIRRGEVRFEEALRLIDEAEAVLRRAVADCTLRADRARINRFMVQAHQDWWNR